MSTRKNFLTPTGRLVAGSLYEPQTKDMDGKPLTIKTGANAGQPTQKYFFALAIKKGAESHWSQADGPTSNAMPEKWGAAIWAVGHAAFPQQAQRPDFAWKITDGDSTIPNKRGNKPCDKEGYPGHWVVSFSSSYAPRILNADGSAPIAEPNAVKCGYFVQVCGTVDGNDSATQAGVYVNHQMVALQGYGPEIVSGPDPTQVGFGGGPAPAGMSTVPTGAMAAPPATVAAPAAAAPPPPPPAAAAVPTVAVVPNPAILAAAAAPPPPPPPAAAAAPPPPPAGPVMTAKANGASYAQMIAAGWTDAALRQHGMLA